MRYVLTKDFTKIATTEGIFQNLSGDANIELTNDISQQGILLKPFQTVNMFLTKNFVKIDSIAIEWMN